VVHVKIKHDEEGLAVEGGETFATLSELIHSYTNRYEQLTEKNGQEILLKQPLNCCDPTSERYCRSHFSIPFCVHVNFLRIHRR